MMDPVIDAKEKDGVVESSAFQRMTQIAALPNVPRQAVKRTSNLPKYLTYQALLFNIKTIPNSLQHLPLSRLSTFCHWI